MRKILPSLSSASLLLLAGCGPAPEEHGHEHAEEPQTAQITVWTDRYEIFAEHQAPVAGKATTFITHVTDLQHFEPRRRGAVTFLMEQGGKTVEHLEAQPARDGIYLPGLVFPNPGEWQLSISIPRAGGKAVVELGMIEVHADAHDAEHAVFGEAPEGVSFLKEQQWKIDFKTIPVERKDLVERIDSPATVKPKPGHKAVLVAPISGRIAAASEASFPNPGHAVHSGELLAFLKPDFSEAAAQLAEAESRFGAAKAELEQAESAFHRIQNLAAQQAKSERELQEAERELETARARFNAAERLLSTFRNTVGDDPGTSALLIELRSPIRGVLNQVEAGPGEIVAAGRPLFTVINPETVWIEAPIPEHSISRLSRTRSAVMEWNGEFHPVTGEGQGHLVNFGLAVDPQTRTVPLIYEMKNEEGLLRIGQRIRLHVETSHAEQAVAIPETAIVEEDGNPIAFVHVSGETFEKRNLTTGIEDSGWIQVLAGIQEGERVVARGAYAIRLSSVSGVIPAHGHAH